MSSFIDNNKGIMDVLSGLKQISLAIYLASSDIRQRYRRSTLGPFWITISTGVMIACIGLIFGKLFKTPLIDFLPFLSCGLIIWGFISSTLTDAALTFVSAEAIIKQLPIPLTTHILRMIARNFFIFLHNIILIPFVLIIVQRPINLNLLFFVPGILILLINLFWISLILSIFCTRFRDLTQIVISILQVFFYITPIIWMPSLLPEKTSLMLIGTNPMFQLIELIRSPLMCLTPASTTYLYTITLAVFGCIASIILFNRFRGRISYWL